MRVKVRTTSNETGIEWVKNLLQQNTELTRPHISYDDMICLETMFFLRFYCKILTEYCNGAIFGDQNVYFIEYYSIFFCFIIFVFHIDIGDCRNFLNLKYECSYSWNHDYLNSLIIYFLVHSTSDLIFVWKCLRQWHCTLTGMFDTFNKK